MAVGDSAVSKQLHVNLPHELAERVQLDAKRRGIGVSTLIRMLVLASYERSDAKRQAAA